MLRVRQCLYNPCVSYMYFHFMCIFLQVPEWIHEGLESAPQAFVNMMTGVRQDRAGKQMVHVSDIQT